MHTYMGKQCSQSSKATRVTWSMVGKDTNAKQDIQEQHLKSEDDIN